VGRSRALEVLGVPLEPAERALWEQTVATVRGGLDEAALAAAWGEGHAMALEQAIDEALALPEAAAAPPPSPPTPAPAVAPPAAAAATSPAAAGASPR
jgi:hypothetical protein